MPATHDVDTNLDRVLETRALEEACAAYRTGARDRATILRCGKWMFFYETFGTVGIPTDLLKFLQRHYADSYFGHGFSEFGFVPDPADRDGMPIGLAPSTGMLGSVKTHAFTCASCHFGQMPDGRYAVGYGNMDLDYGRFLTSLGPPISLSINENDSQVHPWLREALREPVRQAKQTSGYMIDLAIVGMSMLSTGSSGMNMSLEEQELFLRLRPGTMDFLTLPLLDDEVWTVSRILSLWNLPDEAQREAAGMAHEMLSWTGGAKTLHSFLEGFVAIGVSPDEWNVDRLAPLEAYIRSLRTPPLKQDLPTDVVREGATLFVDKGCLDCHNGPSGESAQIYSYEEMGTDPAMKYIFNPTEIPGGELCCGLESGDGFEVTGGVKAPRMTGLENQGRYLHNGSIASLEELFCLAPRDPSTDYAQKSTGHMMTCEGLTEAERRALITYLTSL
jgi:hypothetical protein